MADTVFGGTGGSAWSNNNPLSSTGVSLPTGRAMANGSTSCLITRLFAYVGGNGGSRTVRLSLGSATTPNFTVPNQVATVGTGYRAVSTPWLVNGGTATFSVTFSGGSLRFGRGGSGTTVDGIGSTWAGRIGGAYSWGQAPTAPRNLTVASPQPGQVDASWTAPQNNGDMSITGYRLEYSKNSNFSGATSIELGNVLSHTITGLDEGETYYVRVAAKNAVTTAAGSTSVYSNVEDVQTQSGAPSGPGFGGVPFVPVENFGHFWSLSGHNVGFDRSGSRVEPRQVLSLIDYWNQSTGTINTLSAITHEDAVWATNFERVGDSLYANGVKGDSILFLSRSDGASSRYNIGFKIPNGDDRVELSWQGMPQDSGLGTGQLCSVVIENGVLTVSAERRFGGVPQTVTDTEDISGFSGELRVVVQYYYEVIGGLPHYSLYAIVRDSTIAPDVQANVGYVADGVDVYTEPWQIDGLARAVITVNTIEPIFYPVVDWEVPPSYEVDGLLPETGPTMAWRGSAWDYLQHAATGTGCEFVLVDDQVVVRNIGLNIEDFSNYADAPAVSLNSALAGRRVDVDVSNASLVNLGAMYSASLDGERQFRVDLRETLTEVVRIDGSLQSVLDPIPVSTYPNPSGTYVVTDSEGTTVSPNAWSDAGGSVLADVDDSGVGLIRLTLRGPSVEIPGTVPPYTIGASVNEVPLGALTITGSGVLADTRTVGLLTGVDDSRFTREVATTVSNPFIQNLGDAYDRGSWTALAANTEQSVDFVIATRALRALGTVPGSLIRWREAIYRVVSVSVGAVSSTVTAQWHTTAGDVDGLWENRTAQEWDEFWVGYTAGDNRIVPLRAMEQEE